MVYHLIISTFANKHNETNRPVYTFDKIGISFFLGTDCILLTRMNGYGHIMFSIPYLRSP